MSSSSSGSSFNSSSSSSSPTVVQTPENVLLDQLATYAGQLAPQMMQWAQGAYAKTSAVTDQAVANFFNASQQMMGLAGGLTSQYNNLFAPENAQLVAEANSYASPARMAVDMGMAGATQSQANDAARRNSEQNLLSYGIDPSSGRYAALDKAAQVQGAANVAGAENMQRMADINTGQKLRSEAVQVGSLLPSAITNATNAATQANTGASNASLANANTGANLMSLADKYLQTAMGLKLSPVGQNSQSSGMGTSNNQSQGSQPSQSRGGGDGSGGYGGGGGGQPWMPQHGGGGSGGYGGGGGGRGYNPNAGIMNLPGNVNPNAGVANASDWGAQSDALGGMYNDVGSANFDYLNNPDYQTGTAQLGDQYTQPVDYVGSNPFSDTGFGQTFDFGGQNQTFGGLPDQGNSDFGLGNYTYDPSANQSTADWANNGGGGGSNFDWSSVSLPDTSGGGSSFDIGGAAFNDYGGGASSFGSDYSSSDTGYARGGAVQPTTGGHVSSALSPSGGRKTDDVRAQLNADEFVIPKDVALWKGQEFFHNLIAQARQKNAKAAAMLGPTPVQTSPGPAQFVSQDMGQGNA